MSPFRSWCALRATSGPVPGHPRGGDSAGPPRVESRARAAPARTHGPLRPNRRDLRRRRLAPRRERGHDLHLVPLQREGDAARAALADPAHDLRVRPPPPDRAGHGGGGLAVPAGALRRRSQGARAPLLRAPPAAAHHLRRDPADPQAPPVGPLRGDRLRLVAVHRGRGGAAPPRARGDRDAHAHRGRTRHRPDRGRRSSSATASATPSRRSRTSSTSTSGRASSTPTRAPTSRSSRGSGTPSS